MVVESKLSYCSDMDFWILNASIFSLSDFQSNDPFLESFIIDKSQEELGIWNCYLVIDVYIRNNNAFKEIIRVFVNLLTVKLLKHYFLILLVFEKVDFFQKIFW